MHLDVLNGSFVFLFIFLGGYFLNHKIPPGSYSWSWLWCSLPSIHWPSISVTLNLPVTFQLPGDCVGSSASTFRWVGCSTSWEYFGSIGSLIEVLTIYQKNDGKLQPPFLTIRSHTTILMLGVGIFTIHEIIGLSNKGHRRSLFGLPDSRWIFCTLRSQHN